MKWAELLRNVGFWFAVGIIVGFFIDFVGRWFFEWWFRPIIKIPKEDKDVWWEAATNANLFYFETLEPIDETRQVTEGVTSQTVLGRHDYRDQTVIVYRLKVKNKGRRAAENVAGTVEFKTQFEGERRICWYEGNVATITLNEKDHSFLDVYGVLLGEGKTICMPTENGWKKLHPMRLEGKIEINVRVTAKNAHPYAVRFEIDPEKQCKPRWLDSTNQL